MCAWRRLRVKLKPLLAVCVCVRLCAAEGEETVRRKLRAVHDELADRFRQLEEEFR